MSSQGIMSRSNSITSISNQALPSGRTSMAGSRRGSVDSDISLPYSLSSLKRGKPVGTVKITFMGKTMELLVPMNDDINIYDGSSIEGSKEAKSKNSWVEMFNMMDLAINNLTQQNKELKRTVNELSSKINKMNFHDRKETKSSPETQRKPAKPEVESSVQVQEITKKVDRKIEKVEENILQWIDEEAKAIRDVVEKDISTFREEVDTKNVELISRVQTQISDLKDEVAEQVTSLDSRITDSIFAGEGEGGACDPVPASTRQIIDLKDRIHRNSNLLRFLISEPLSVQFSIWNKPEVSAVRGEGGSYFKFNHVNCNAGGAVDDDGITSVDRIIIPISGTYLIALAGHPLMHGGGLAVRRNNRDKVMEWGRSEILELNEDDELRVWMEEGTKVKDVNFIGVLLRPRIFIAPGSTM